MRAALAPREFARARLLARARALLPRLEPDILLNLISHQNDSFQFYLSVHRSPGCPCRRPLPCTSRPIEPLCKSRLARARASRLPPPCPRHPLRYNQSPKFFFFIFALHKSLGRLPAPPVATHNELLTASRACCRLGCSRGYHSYQKSMPAWQSRRQSVDESFFDAGLRLRADHMHLIKEEFRILTSVHLYECREQKLCGAKKKRNAAEISASSPTQAAVSPVSKVANAASRPSSAASASSSSSSSSVLFSCFASSTSQGKEAQVGAMEGCLCRELRQRFHWHQPNSGDEFAIRGAAALARARKSRSPSRGNAPRCRRRHCCGRC